MCITARPQRLLVKEHGKITLEIGSLPLLLETIACQLCLIVTAITLLRVLALLCSSCVLACLFAGCLNSIIEERSESKFQGYLRQ